MEKADKEAAMGQTDFPTSVGFLFSRKVFLWVTLPFHPPSIWSLQGSRNPPLHLPSFSPRGSRIELLTLWALNDPETWKYKEMSGLPIRVAAKQEGKKNKPPRLPRSFLCSFLSAAGKGLHYFESQFKPISLTNTQIHPDDDKDYLFCYNGMPGTVKHLGKKCLSEITFSHIWNRW